MKREEIARKNLECSKVLGKQINDQIKVLKQ